MTITISPHITLRPLTLEHQQSVLNLVNNSRQHLAKYLYWVDSVVDNTSCHRYIDQRINSGLNGAQWQAIYFNNKLVGIFAVKSVSNEGIAELGYWLTHTAVGHGIINQIIAQAPLLLLQDTPAHTIEICCLCQNQASINIAKKAGATLHHIKPDYLEHNQQMQSLHVYRKSLSQ